MHPRPSSLDTKQLADCLRAAAGDERDRQVDFLRYLDPFDAREAWRELGYESLWRYCLGELRLREGAAGRRIGAMRVLREFPRLEAPLRDGRLSLTTAVTLRPVLTEQNLDEVVHRASGRTDEETRHLVASLQPQRAPREGIRRLPIAMMAVQAAANDRATPPEQEGASSGGSGPADHARAGSTGEEPGGGGASLGDGSSDGRARQTAGGPQATRASVDPVSEAAWSMRVTIGAAFRADLEVLKAMLGHKIPNGDVAEVLHEAIRCAIEKHGKRRGAVKPARARKTARTVTLPATGGRAHIPAPVRREVWARDGGRCTFLGSSGRRCESRTRLEFDHIDPASRGRPPVAADLRLRCRPHNLLHAEQTYGREYMSRFRKRQRPRVTPSPIAGERRTRSGPGASPRTTRTSRKGRRPPS